MMLSITEILSQLTSRQVAAFIWIIIFIIVLLFVRGIRTSLTTIIPMLFQRTILIPFLFIMASTGLILYVSYIAHVWNSAHFVLVILWYCTFVCTTFFTLQLHKSTSFVMFMLKEIFTITVVIDFIVNMQSFPLAIELIMVPIVVTASILFAFTDKRPEYASVYQIIARFLALLGFSYVLYSLIVTLSEWNGITMKQALWDMMLPLLFSVAMIPSFYLLKVYSAYENLFMRIRMYTPHVSDRRSLQRAAIQFCFLRLTTIQALELKWPRRLHSGIQDAKQYIHDTYYTT